MPIQMIYKSSLALLTDLYQLTMAYGYWKNGTHEKETVFNLFFRKHPFKGNYTVFCGLHQMVSFLDHFSFDNSDLAYLGTLQGNDGSNLFDDEFLDYLENMKFSCDVDTMEEGRVVFPHEPLLRIKGPMIQCQLLETVLLNMINFQTLIATKAARVSSAAKGDPVLEFGLRRAQGIDGALSASRAAYVGGCAGTSNVLAGKLFGIPIRGTHAHSWVMSFDDEMEAFEAYADAMPNNCVFLVDTYDTLAGVRKACEVGAKLRAQGYEMAGIRLDSGDLTQLSIDARKILDEKGFPEAKIVASNDLDEYSIKQLKEDGAQIAVWGVGTKLATAYDQPALGGVYKLAAIREGDQDWNHKLKLSEDSIKTSNPGVQQVRRFTLDGQFVGDLIYEEGLGVEFPVKMMTQEGDWKTFGKEASSEDLLKSLYRQGERIRDLPILQDVRNFAIAEVDAFRIMEDYPVGLEQNLHQLKERLMSKAAKQG